MSKILAIKGDRKRGNEVIALLEMLGGNNRWKASGNIEKVYYSISNGVILYGPQIVKDTVIFTLDKFYKKYPYKVGDIVKTGKDEEGVIKQMRWVDNDIVYWVNSHKTCDWPETLSVDILDKYNRLNSNDMDVKVEYPGRNREDVLFDSIIWHLRNSVNNGKQYLSGGDCEAYFRELVKKVNENDMESCKCPEYEDIKKVAYLSINDKDYADEIEVNLGDDYEYKFEMNRLYILKKKPKYPKLRNLTECKEILGEKDMYQSVSGYKGELLTNFQRLIIFRDAYWKIAGEQMGLDKPWEPDWDNLSTNHEFIKINKGCFTYSSRVLVFPTEEMRDVFCENFKDLIEQCKELL